MSGNTESHGDQLMTETHLAYPAIRCRGATRVYRLPGGEKRVAVADLDLEVPAGGVFGFLGANGAGKTTTIKMLLGFLKPTSGRLEIFGEPCSEPQTRRHVGYLPEQPYFHPFLSPREVLRVHADLMGIPRREQSAAIDEALELTGLQKNRNLALGRLSKGNQQRVGIAQALLGSPRLLILDEPTSGLDPVARHEMRGIIARLREEGRTIFLSSHVLSEIDTLCDRVAILKQGRLAACGTPEEIKQGGSTVRVSAAFLTPIAERELQGLGVQWDTGHEVTIECSPDQVYPVLRALEKGSVPLRCVTPSSETLEGAFLRLAA